MDLGVLLVSPEGSKSSSLVGTCPCAFLPSCSSSVRLQFEWIMGSVVSLEAFPGGSPRGFPTGLSLMPQLCESILGLKVEVVQGMD